MNQQNETLARYYSKKKKMKQRRRTAFFTLVVVLCIVVVTVLSLTVFFNVDSITVEGEKHYSEAQIIKISRIEKGQNLFRMNKFKIIDRLKAELPYLENVKIRRNFMGKIGLIITVEETEPYMYVRDGKGYCLVDHNLKVLETVEKKPKNIANISGVKAENAVPGEPLTCKDGVEKHLLQLTPILHEHLGAGNITEINITAVYDIRFVYEDRVSVKLGTLEKIEQKVQLTKHILDKNSKSEHAEIDVSSGERAFYKPID